MSENNKKYLPFVGRVEFDPDARDVNGKDTLQFTIKLANNSSEPKVRVTLWPELREEMATAGVPEPKKGDFVNVHGTFTTTQKDGTTYSNLSADSIGVVPMVRSAGPGVAKKESTASAEPAF